MTAQNAALVEQAGAAAQCMHDEAHALSGAVGMFTLKQVQKAAARPKTGAAAAADWEEF